MQKHLRISQTFHIVLLKMVVYSFHFLLTKAQKQKPFCETIWE